MTGWGLPPALALLGGTLALAASGAAGMATGGGESPQTRLLPAHSTPAGGPMAVPFPDGPPARVTGGFGEDSCLTCHWDGSENDGVGTLTVSGFPEAYASGAEYELTIDLGHPSLVSGGFQLAIRTREGGTQAGSLHPAGTEAARVGILEDRDVQFAHQTAAGARPSGEGKTGWAVRWTAPEADSGPLLLHLSAVAGDGDASQMGDAVYTVELESRPGDR